MGKKNMKRYSSPLVIWKMQVKIPSRYQFIPTIMVIIKQHVVEDVEKLEASHIATGNIKCYNNFGKLCLIIKC